VIVVVTIPVPAWATVAEAMAALAVAPDLEDQVRAAIERDMKDGTLETKEFDTSVRDPGIGAIGYQGLLTRSAVVKVRLADVLARYGVQAPPQVVGDPVQKKDTLPVRRGRKKGRTLPKRQIQEQALAWLDAEGKIKAGFDGATAEIVRVLCVERPDLVADYRDDAIADAVQPAVNQFFGRSRSKKPLKSKQLITRKLRSITRN